MRFLFYIALHKRLEVTRRVFEKIRELQSDFDIQVFCVCSSYEEADLCWEFDFHYTIEDNFPLGRKFNIGLREAMKLDFTHLMQLGSDDIITKELLTEYLKHEDKDYFGVNRYHLVDKENKKAKKWIYGLAGSEINHPIGAGRVFSKKALENVLSKTDLWEDGWQKILDGRSDERMIMNGYRAHIIRFDGVGIIDIKTDENIWSFDEVDGQEYSYEELEVYL